MEWLERWWVNASEPGVSKCLCVDVDVRGSCPGISSINIFNQHIHWRAYCHTFMHERISAFHARNGIVFFLQRHHCLALAPSFALTPSAAEAVLRAIDDWAARVRSARYGGRRSACRSVDLARCGSHGVGFGVLVEIRLVHNELRKEGKRAVGVLARPEQRTDLHRVSELWSEYMNAWVDVVCISPTGGHRYDQNKIMNS